MAYTYHPVCRGCSGEGTVEVEVASMAGVGGFIIQTQACPVCRGTGEDASRTITIEDEALAEDAAA